MYKTLLGNGCNMEMALTGEGMSVKCDICDRCYTMGVGCIIWCIEVNLAEHMSQSYCLCLGDNVSASEVVPIPGR
jgi:hypothetical protein